MLDMIIRCGAQDKTDFVFFDTGLEYAATKEHLDFLEQKYSITIERVKAVKPIPKSVKDNGVPFWSKYASEMIYRLQSHGFKFEDEPFEVLIKKYPRCKVALTWWCNVSKGTSMYIIDRAPYLKQFMIENPPNFKISNKCCEYAKKKASKQYLKRGDYDLECVGIRKSEGGVRAAVYKNCFYSGKDIDRFMPVFWLSDSDKAEYCKHYDVTHSDCYTKYGLYRTGCFGCPFGKRFEEELKQIKEFEPKLYDAANNIFGESYEYTRKYMAYREQKKRETEEKKKLSEHDA